MTSTDFQPNKPNSLDENLAKHFEAEFKLFILADNLNSELNSNARKTIWRRQSYLPSGNLIEGELKAKIKKIIGSNEALKGKSNYRTVRLRHSRTENHEKNNEIEENFFLDIKVDIAGDGDQKLDVEFKITQDQHNNLNQHALGSVEKVRKEVPIKASEEGKKLGIDDLVLEIDTIYNVCYGDEVYTPKNGCELLVLELEMTQSNYEGILGKLDVLEGEFEKSKFFEKLFPQLKRAIYSEDLKPIRKFSMKKLATNGPGTLLKIRDFLVQMKSPTKTGQET